MPDTGFFRLSREWGRWLLVTPEGRPFFSLGLNHVDSATLRYPENLSLWRERYNNSQARWLGERVGPDLLEWGFNTLGWCQEVVTRGPTNHRHSRSFTFEEYQWLGLPYCHLLPFAEIHQWEVETHYPDLFASEFEDWCDHVARTDCARMADDPKLIGYFYTDCPTWIHPTQNPERKGPWFDPHELTTAAGRRELRRLAERYYTVTHAAIRRYDPHHLIFGDRYEAGRPLAAEVLETAAATVDALSFQHFSAADKITANLRLWHERTGRPCLLADACCPRRDTTLYAELLEALWATDCCLGWHYCGAYLRNRIRQAGFRTERDEVDEALVAPVREANRALAARLDSLASPQDRSV